MRVPRAVPTLALVALMLVAANPATAQDFAPQGIGPYDTAYVVYGRIVDGRGYPIVGLPYRVSLKDTLDNTETTGGPVEGQTRNRGELQADFAVGQVTQYGTVTLEVHGKRIEKKLDPELRRTDFIVVLDDYLQPNFPPDGWNGTFSLRVRVVNLTDPYPAPAWGELYAKPVPGVLVQAMLVNQDGHGFPIAFTRTLTHGDWNYTYTLPQNVTGGYVVFRINDQVHNLTLQGNELKARYLFLGAKLGTSRLPTSYDKETPQPTWVTPFALAAAALVGVWWFTRRRRDGDQQP